LYEKEFLEDCLSVFNSAFFNNGPIIGFIWNDDEDWSVQAVSKNVEKLLGYDLDSFKNNQFLYKKIIHTDDLSCVVEEVSSNKKNKVKTFSHKAYRLKNNKNEFIWIHDSTTILYDSTGNVICYVGHIVDCTEEIKNLQLIEKNKSEILKSKQIWIDAIERNGDGYWEWNFLDKKLFFSPQWKNLFGYDDEDEIRTVEDWEKLVHNEDLESIYEDVRNHINKKTHLYSNEHRILCKDGSYKWVLDKGAISEYDESNNPIKMIGIYRDITNIKEEENKVKSILKNIPDLVWIKDVNGQYVLCNKRFEQLYSDIEENIVGKTDYDYVSKELADFFSENDLKALNSTKPLSNIEEVIFANDGHSEILYTTKTKVYKSDGTILGILGISKDITELKKKEEEFEAIFNYSIDGLAILDLEGNFLDFNDSFLKITRRTRAELKNMTCQSLSIKEDYEKSLLAFEEIKTKGFVKNLEKRIVVDDGKTIVLNLSAVLLPDKKRILESIKDITDTKLLETQSKLASMGEMIGNIAHQWRQPLSVISTIASGIKIEKEYELLNLDELIPNMNNIVEQTQYLSKTIDDFRNFVRNDECKKTFTLNDAVTKSLAILKATFKNNDIKVIFENLDFKHEIYGFENEFIQALINILNNSKDALKDQENLENRLIIISSSMMDKKFVLEILDNAGGIEENILNKIFEPYFTTKYKSSGTGLGLSITYKIFKEHHNADILVCNKNFQYENMNCLGASFQIVFNLD
jgi:PAS domain S-box-containing protein